MTERIGLTHLEPARGGLDQLRIRIDRRRRRVAGLQAGAGVLLVLVLVAVMKGPREDSLPAWAAQHPTFRVSQSGQGVQLRLRSGVVQSVMSTDRVSAYLMDTGMESSDGAGSPPV